jgi:hypothetical protein
MNASRIGIALFVVLLSASGCSSCNCGGGAVPGAAVAGLMPGYSVGFAAVRNIPELTADVGLAQLVAAAGPEAQRGWAAMTGILGFDPSNPATMEAAGLDPAAPVAWGVTRVAGEQTSVLLFVGATDAARAMNYLVSKAPLAGITITGQVPLGEQVVYTGTGEVAVAATSFDKTIVIAFGPPTSQPMGAIQELVAVKGGSVPSLSASPAFSAAMARMGGADVVGFLNVPTLIQGLQAIGEIGADEAQFVAQLQRVAAISAAIDIQGGVLSTRWFTADAPGTPPGFYFSQDATDGPVLDRIGGTPLFSVRTTLNLPAIWAQTAAQIPALNELRQPMMESTGLNLDTDIIGALSGTFSLTGFRIGSQPAANDLVATVGITDPAKVQQIVNVVSSRGLAPTTLPVGQTPLYTWNLDGFPVSLAIVGSQAVVGIGRDANGMAPIVMGQAGPSFRTQIRDPAVAERFGKGGNGAAFVNVGPLMQQIAAIEPDAAAFGQAWMAVDTFGMFAEAADGGSYAEVNLRLVQGQTLAGWFTLLAQIGAARAAQPPPPPPPTF